MTLFEAILFVCLILQLVAIAALIAILVTWPRGSR